MGEKIEHPDSILTLPVVVGVLVVLGAVAALAVSGLFVYRAHRVNVETERIHATLQAERKEQSQQQIVTALEDHEVAATVRDTPR